MKKAGNRVKQIGVGLNPLKAVLSFELTSQNAKQDIAKAEEKDGAKKHLLQQFHKLLKWSKS